MVKEMVGRAKRKFLHAAGQHATNQAAEMAHKKFGTLKNSITYQTQEGGSEFSTQYGPGVPPEDAKVSKPSGDVVRVGSALVYANPQERHNAFMTKALDRITSDGSLEKIAEEVFRS
jgi:hypothetical protein